jgi:glycosyltransferase XagB
VAFGGVIGAATRRAAANGRPDSGSPRATVRRASSRALPAQQPAACPEINCVRALLPRHIIAAAERRAHSIGLGADRVLISADAITEEAYLAALASSLGTSYEPLERTRRTDCPLDDNQLIQAAAAGLLPLREDGEIVWIIAPRCLTARRLADPRQSRPDWLRSFRLTSSERLWRFVARYTQTTLGRKAAEGLHDAAPLLSNAPRPVAWKKAAGAALLILAVTILALVPAATIKAVGSLLCAIFLAAASLRLASALYTSYAPEQPTRIDDERLPIYTIICALYREANVVRDLVAALRALDYPIEKLDVKFVLEADDDETRSALARLDLGPPFEIITAPPIGPRTKPKALNVALPLARGLYIVVYDAEDVPEPDQLRRAVSAFMSSDDRLAGLQASLTIDNTSDNWLARIFTANYAGQFDVLLPGLAALQLPFPLGGSSNHFRTSVLRKAGGWDPYNVTEDADLGIRLYRLGYRVAALASATYEEAPARFVPWLKQRTRWYKGWMQTWRVHMRRPLRLVRELRPAGAIAFQLFLACNVLAALIHPIFMAGLCYSLLAQPTLQAVGAMGHEAPVFATTLLAGYASTIALDLIGLRRRGLLAHAWVLVLTPLYWFLLSLAAWRALLQLTYDPQRWEKTEHGLARNSRIAEAARRESYSDNRLPAAPATIMATTADRFV